MLSLISDQLVSQGWKHYLTLIPIVIPTTPRYSPLLNRDKPPYLPGDSMVWVGGIHLVSVVQRISMDQQPWTPQCDICHERFPHHFDNVPKFLQFILGKNTQTPIHYIEYVYMHWKKQCVDLITFMHLFVNWHATWRTIRLKQNINSYMQKHAYWHVNLLTAGEPPCETSNH